MNLLRGIHKFYSTGRWVLRIVVSAHLLVLLCLYLADFFVDLFNKKKIIYQVQIVSTGDLNPQQNSTPTKSKPTTEPKKKEVEPKVIPKKSVVMPKKVVRTKKKSVPKKKKVVVPKKVTPKKKRAQKKKTVVRPKRKVVKPKRKVRTIEEIRRDFNKNLKPAKPTKKRRDLSHLLKDKKVSAKDISKRFSQAMNSVKVSQSHSGTTSNYNYSNYYSSLVPYIYGRWDEPELPQNYATIIEVTISRWGTVLKKRIIKRSGNTVMDNSVQRMLNSLTKLPKLPATSKDKELTFTITLQLKK